MVCELGYSDCKYEDSAKCFSCFAESPNYEPKEIKIKKQLNKRQQKQDKRQGSYFEYKNHKANEQLLANTVTSKMTLNSGATVREKGDEQISGLISIMEELKTKTATQAPGKRTFTIQEKWLSKLRNEARAENKEFYYLKFSFHENDEQVYVITEQEQIMSMVKTMVEDRRQLKEEQLKYQVLAAQLNVLKAKLLEREAELALINKQNEHCTYREYIQRGGI